MVNASKVCVVGEGQSGVCHPDPPGAWSHGFGVSVVCHWTVRMSSSEVAADSEAAQVHCLCAPFSGPLLLCAS